MQNLYRIILILSFLPLVLTAMPQSAAAQEATCAEDVIVQAGDTMSSIASRYYGDAQVYPRIVEATNQQATSNATYATIVNANVLRVGWKLCLPGPLNGRAETPTRTVTPTRTATPSPSQPVTRASTPVPAPTGNAVATPEQPVVDRAQDEVYPAMIEYMRQQSYPGSQVVIDRELNAGANYRRYVVSYESEGSRIFALLTVPNGVAPQTGWPVIIFNHGYIPPEVYRTTERYVAYQDAFARNGYITLKPDYRGHGFSEGEPSHSPGFHDYTVDVLNAVASIQTYPGADSERIGMWGHSMGGSITLRSMVIMDDVKVGVIWAGTVASIEQVLSRWDGGSQDGMANVARRRWGPWRQDLEARYGTLAENPEFWASISPNSYVADLSGPILLQHGTGDVVVPAAYSQVLNQQIRAVGGDVEYIEYPGDDHNISGNLTSALSSAVAYFDRYLK